MAFSGVGGNVVKHILPTFSEAVDLLKDKYSSLIRKTSIRHITLPPKYLGRLKAGVNDIINADLGLYSDRLGGVMIAFSNLRMCKPTGTIVDDQAFIHFDVQLDEIIFKPAIGSWLKGIVNKKGENYIGCLVHRCFNASIPKPKHQVNGWIGFDLELGEEFLFCVTRLESAHDVLSIAGMFNDSEQNYDLADGALPNEHGSKVKRKSNLKKVNSLPNYDEAETLSNIKIENDSDNEQETEDIKDESKLLHKHKSKKAKKRQHDSGESKTSICSPSSEKHKIKKSNKRQHDSEESETSMCSPSSEKHKIKKSKKRQHDSEEMCSPPEKLIKQEVEEHPDVKQKKHKKHKKHKKKLE
ncbi:DNA-directed RNA polymerase I subunit RPA43-like [Antedon mediterranea]|uniref:DNA-directed RNA polymerase I subunit RPA43-like n=1 Tax=Antedon mediterranea TaxID=105859 RepID=UPI003AF9C148